jgi:hypothetical protein
MALFSSSLSQSSNGLGPRRAVTRPSFRVQRTSAAADQYETVQSMTTLTETVQIRAPAKAVFAHVDDICNLGWHMTGRSSMALMGSRLKLEILSGQATGLGAT